MEHYPQRNQPPAPQAPAAPPTPDRAHWTPAKQRVFLTELMEKGSVAAAARAVGMSRSSAHRLRQRLTGTVFDKSWATALRFHADALASPFGTPGQTPAGRADDPPGSAW